MSPPVGFDYTPVTTALQLWSSLSSQKGIFISLPYLWRQHRSLSYLWGTYRSPLSLRRQKSPPSQMAAMSLRITQKPTIPLSTTQHSIIPLRTTQNSPIPLRTTEYPPSIHSICQPTPHLTLKTGDRADTVDWIIPAMAIRWVARLPGMWCAAGGRVVRPEWWWMVAQARGLLSHSSYGNSVFVVQICILLVYPVMEDSS